MVEYNTGETLYTHEEFRTSKTKSNHQTTNKMNQTKGKQKQNKQSKQTKQNKKIEKTKIKQSFATNRSVTTLKLVTCRQLYHDNFYTYIYMYVFMKVDT